MHGQQNIRI